VRNHGSSNKRRAGLNRANRREITGWLGITTPGGGREGKGPLQVETIPSKTEGKKGRKEYPMASKGRYLSHLPSAGPTRPAPTPLTKKFLMKLRPGERKEIE